LGQTAPVERVERFPVDTVADRASAGLVAIVAVATTEEEDPVAIIFTMHHLVI
jgi:hypothetical protein